MAGSAFGRSIQDGIELAIERYTPAELSEKAIRIILFVLIAGGLAFRLYAFYGPILDHHFLRQVDTAALARNFAEEGMNIFYPRVDWRGASTGYVESEFQIYTYLVALLYRAFGEHVEFARLLNSLFFVLCALVLFEFGRRMFDARAALLAVFFYAFAPINAYFAHSFQPDTLMVLTSFSALFFFWRWTESGRNSHLALSALALCIALLIKPTNVYLALPMLYLCARQFGWDLFKKPQLWIYGIAVLAPALLWYSHAYQLWVEHGNTLFRAYSYVNLDWMLGKHYPNPVFYATVVAWYYVYMVATPAGLLPLVVGAREAIEERNYLLIAWVAGFAATMIFFAHQYAGHDYYQLPMAIVASLLMGAGVVQIWKMEESPRKIAALVCVAYVLLNIYWRWQGHLPNYRLIFVVSGFVLLLGFALLRRQHRVLILASLAMTVLYGAWQTRKLTIPTPQNIERLEFAAHLEQVTEPGARLVVAENHVRPEGWFQHRTEQGELLGFMPIDFYFSHRKGWSISGAEVQPAFIETLRGRGAAYFATASIKDFPGLRAYLDCAHTRLDASDQFAIYRLDPPRSRPDGSPCLDAASGAR